MVAEQTGGPLIDKFDAGESLQNMKNDHQAHPMPDGSVERLRVVRRWLGQGRCARRRIAGTRSEEFMRALRTFSGGHGALADGIGAGSHPADHYRGAVCAGRSTKSRHASSRSTSEARRKPGSVENRPGAGTVIGSTTSPRLRPTDTLLQAAPRRRWRSTVVHKALPYDSATDPFRSPWWRRAPSS